MWARIPFVVWLLAIAFAVVEVSWAASFNVLEAQLTTGRPSGQGSISLDVAAAWTSSVRSLLGTVGDQTLLDLVSDRITARTWTSSEEARELLELLVSLVLTTFSRRS